ncbi:MAG: sulfatase-like hydrolase/transferase, partial [Acidobacteria bacterium]|nr:sulfatase-like hydrolase/transferase [Acidobacteriota bacterium]
PGAWGVLRPRAFAIEVNADRNILLVTIDTLRADALGAYGGGAATPNLDALAAGGARFDFAHAHAVVTLPSHASILSGRYPYEHGVRDNTGYRFSGSQPTAASLLKNAGFSTGAFVSGFPLDGRFGLDAGFDHYDDRLDAESALEAGGGERERRADATVKAASAWIGRQPGRWMAWVHLYDPHAPYAPPQEFAARYPGSLYLGEVSWTDHALGPLLRTLAALPRHTLVIVTSDHGEALGEHGEATHGIFAYEETLRVPLIIAETGEGRAPGGVTIASPVRHVDLLPTMLEAVGVASGPGLPGASLAGVIAGDAADRPSYFESMMPAVTRGWAPLRGVLSGREKYIDLPIPELYDLAADPRETVNLAPAESSRTQVFFNLLKGFNLAPPSRAAAETPETLERLRSLGYIGGGTSELREMYTEADDPKRLIALEQALQRAAEAQRQGRFDEAVALYRDVIARRADTEDAYRKLALLYWRQGRADEAVATLELALRNGVTQSEVRIKLGEYLAESGRPARAIELLSATAGRDPDALIALGNAYTLADRPRDAIATYERLLAVDPDNALAYENIGAAYLGAGRHAEAEGALRKALSLDPNLAGAHTALGVALAATGRSGEAIESWTRAIALDPVELNALFNITLHLVQAGRMTEAIEYGERFLAAAPAYMAADAATIRRVLRR